MNPYKPLCFLFAFLFAAMATLNAQQGRAPVPLDSLAKGEANFLAYHLKLTVEQRKQVQALTRTNMVQMDSVRRLPLEEGVRVSTLSKLARDYRAALKGLFTAAQYASYEALIAEQRKKALEKAKNVRELPQ